MSVFEIDDRGIRVIGYNEGIKFYSPDRTLQQEIVLQEDNTLNIGEAQAGGGGGGGGGVDTHALDSSTHVGTLANAQAPQFLLKDGSRDLQGDLLVEDAYEIRFRDSALAIWSSADGQLDLKADVEIELTAPTVDVSGNIAVGGTVDGVDVSDHAANADAHHAGFVGLDGDSGSASPDGSDKVTVAGGSGISTSAAGSEISVSVNLVDAWSGLEFSSVELRVDLDAGFTWTAAHEFQAGLTITAGQDLSFGADVALTRGGADVLNIASGDAFRSSNFSSGVSGWSIDADGTAEFLNCFVRGELHAAVFVKDLIEARAGSLVIVKSAGALTSDVAVPGSGTWEITVNDPPGGGFLFENSDICRIKVEYSGGVGDIWFTVSARADNGDGTQSYTCTYQSGTRSITYLAGAPVLDYGVSGDGGILMTADLNNAPWISVFDHAGSPWTTTTSHLKIGNLNGEADYSSDEYGVFIGDYAGDSWMAYDPTNGLRIRGDGIIDGTLSATKFTNDMGALFFSNADGLLLLGPGCEIDTSEWISTRGQAATISGAFHQEQGHWLGTHGIVIEKAAMNYVLAPRMIDNGADGRADGWAFWDNLGSGNDPTYTVVTHPVSERGWMQKVEYTAVAGDAANTVLAPYDFTSAASFAAGDDCTFSCDIITDVRDGVVISLQLQAQNAAYGSLGEQTLAVGTQPGRVQHLSVTYENLPANTDHVRIGIVVQSIDNGDEFNYRVGAVNVEKTDYPSSFCCGALPWCSWSGDEDNSTSTRVATEVNLDDHVDLINENKTVSYSIWAQMPYDADATWPEATYNYLMHALGTLTHYHRLYFNAATDTWVMTISPGVGVTSAAQSFSAGDWVHLVATIDYTNDEYTLYIDAVEAGQSTTAATVKTLTAWNIGSDTDGTQMGNFIVGEFAIFDRVLTAEEVAALYHRSGPLIDSGALHGPGVYIFDGRFALASSTADKRVEIVSAGIGIYEDNGETGVGRLLGGFVDTTNKVLDETSDDLGWFGYDGDDTLQVAWYGSGDDAGKILAGEGTVVLDEYGITIETSTSLVRSTCIEWRLSGGFKARVGAYSSGVFEITGIEAVIITAGDPDDPPTTQLADFDPDGIVLYQDTELDTGKNLVLDSGTISTDGGTTTWALGGYSAGAPTADGYVELEIGGNTYQLLANAV